LPWPVTALTTTNIQIHGIDIDLNIETRPGTPNEYKQIGVHFC
jgi:hypothetical protein